ncbi:MAG: hypothetical protein ACOYI5_03915 [Christensenellales bacterium]|jgi:hypothetical protein
MKRILGLLLAACMIFAAPAVADELFELGGVVTEVADAHLILSTEEFGEVQVNFDENTQLLGIEDTFEVDSYVIVHYDGSMTRSIPAQIYAQCISMHIVRGTVVEATENTALVEQFDDLGPVIVHLADGMAPLYVGSPVAVYYGGIMLLSYPGQLGAMHITTPAVHGDVTEIGDGYFLLTDDEGAQWRANRSEETIFDDAIAVGDRVTAYYNGDTTRSLPPQFHTIAIIKDAPVE